MATVLDTTLFESFSVIFTFILVFIVVYGALEISKLLKNRALHAMAGFAIAVLSVFSPFTVSLIETMVPWFLVIGVFIFFVFLIGNFMGIEHKTMVSALGGNNAIWWILVLGFIIVAGALSEAFGQALLEEREDDDLSQRSNVIVTLTTPKVLGFTLIFLIAAFTVIFMAGKGRIAS